MRPARRWVIVGLAAAGSLLVSGQRAEAACSVVVAASNASFGSATSFAVRTTPFQASTTNAGLVCSGVILTALLSTDHVYATLQSANGGLLGPGDDVIPYTVFGDPSHTVTIPLGVPFDYAGGTLLNLLGLFGGPPTSLPMYFRTVVGPNVAAGTYTDTITINWNWDYCTLGVVICLFGRDVGSGVSTFPVSMTVTNACQVTAAPDVNLGQAPTATRFSPVHQSLSVVCTKNLATYTVGVSPGLNPSAGRRRMTGGGNFLQYDVLKAGGGSVWGESGADRATNTAPGHGVAAEIFDYVVEIYQDQSTPPPGVYTDIVIVDVSFF